jgi:polyhydroxyalkanoate synthesis regulator phasin
VDDVQALVDHGDLAANKATVLFTHLENAQDDLEKGKPEQAIKQLEQFNQLVEILVKQGNLAVEHGAALIAEAGIIIDSIE